jgi:predicted transcriptional regulator
MKEILLSMQPSWYELCVAGIKIYEYRKNFPDEDIIAYIYVSSPEKAIKGIMYFGDRIVLEDWKEKYKSRPAVIRRIDKYLERNGYAVPIKRIDILDSISLVDIKENVKGFVAPQMYYFLNEGT